MTNLLRNSVQIYIDGSKMNGAVGARIFSESVGIAQSISLSDLCSVFQVEMVSIQATADIIGDKRVSKQNVTIFSDCQAAIRALRSNVKNSKTVYGCPQISQ